MNKKSLYLLVIIVTAILLLMLGATKVNAIETTEDGLWNLGFQDEEGCSYGNFEQIYESGHTCVAVQIERYNGNANNVTIPSKYKGVNVTRIAYEALENCTSIKNITIPNTITEIDSEAFAYCTNLESTVIPSSVKEMGHNVFKGCINLKNITIYKNTNAMGEDIFEGVKDLTITCDPDSRALQYAFDDNCKFVLTTKANIATSDNIWSYIDIDNKTYSGKAKKTYTHIGFGYNTYDSFYGNHYSDYNLREGTDYTVSYKNNVEIGTATVTLTGKGNFTGTITNKFKIVPARTNIKSAKNSSKKAIKVKWNKDTNATGYEVYVSEKVVDNNYMIVNARELSVRAKPTTKSYEYDILGRGQKVRILKRNVKKANGYTWYKIRVEEEAYTTEGYVASEYLSTAYKAKKYKNVKTITKNNTTSYTIKNLKKGKTYYVKVRSYKTVNGKKYYSNYSTVKTVKIKK